MKGRGIEREKKVGGDVTFHLATVSTLMPAKSCHYACRLILDMVVQECALVDCACACRRESVSVMDEGVLTKSSLKMLCKISCFYSLDPSLCF